MDARDNAIRLLVTMLRDVVAAHEANDEIKLGEQVAGAKAFLQSVAAQPGGIRLEESTRIGESLDVQVSRATH
jgi:hypothetical protein